MSGGKLPGMVCIVSSKRYPGQFTDEIEAKAQRQLKETGSSKIYVYDKTIWQVYVMADPRGYFAHRKKAVSGMASFNIAKGTLNTIGLDCPIWLIGISE